MYDSDSSYSSDYDSKVSERKILRPTKRRRRDSKSSDVNVLAEYIKTLNEDRRMQLSGGQTHPKSWRHRLAGIFNPETTTAFLFELLMAFILMLTLIDVSLDFTREHITTTFRVFGRLINRLTLGNVIEALGLGFSSFGALALAPYSDSVEEVGIYL